ncbi:hypothetical protein IMSAGC021_00245 [Muribaculaceae bacterium]|nr:hypothetical protein IMSAGC021_00245 [Muribaculaceae bacterium]
MFKEGDERCGDRGDLRWRYVHKLYLVRSDDREVGVHTGFDSIVDEAAVVVDRRIALGYDFAFFDFGCEIDNFVVLEVDHTVFHFTVGGLDEAEVVDLGVDTERGDKTDVRAFRGFDRAETSVVGIVYVSDLEACALARETAGAEGRHTALVGDFGQRVGLVHELREGVGAEECVDDARNGLGVDEVNRGEDFVVTHIHAFADGARHAGEAYVELVVKLFAYGAHTAVAQVVDIVDIGLRVDELDQIFDDGDDVFLCEHLDIHRGCEAEFLVDTVAAYFAEVIALFREEKVGDDFARACIVRRLGVAELSVNVLDSFFLGVGCIFLECVEYDGVVGGVGVFLVEEYGLHARIEDFLDVLFFKDSLAVEDDVVTLDRHNFTGIFVNEVFNPGLEHAGGEFAAYGFL